MDVSRREIVAHATLVFYEIAAVPLSILATFFVLFFVGGLLWMTQFVGEWIGISSSVIDGVSGLIVALMFVVMAATGGFVVRRYQRMLEKSFGDLGPLPVLAVPLVGVVAVTVYAVVHLGTFSPPRWITLIVALGVYALTFRAIAVYSMLDGARRTGARIGTVAGVPVAIALVTLVTGIYLDAGMNEAGQLVITTVTDAGVPLDPMLLVGVPALIALAYGIYCTVDDGLPLHVPDRSLPSVPRLGLLDRLGSTVWPDRSSQSGSGSTSRAPPPSSPTSARSRNRRSPGSGSSQSSFRGGGGSASKQSAGSSSSATGSGGSRSSNDGSSGGGSSDGGSEARSSANDAGGASSEDASGSGSDTRIFTDDFGAYSNGGSPVETCPDCGDDIPSDGVYKFCPHCGSEL